MVVKMIPNVKKAWLSPGTGFLLGIALALSGALVVDHLGADDDSAQSPSSSESSATTLKQLSDLLADEVQARRKLTDRISELEAKLSRLRRMNAEGMRIDLAQIESSAKNSNSGEDDGEEASFDSDEVISTSGFDDEALLSRGIHARDVARLRDRWVSYEMDTVSIAHRGLREGWFLKSRHGAELARLDQELRADLEDTDYDRYLYASGKPNRLRAREVLPGSSASEGGLRRGDIILRYDDVRIFRPGELLVASSGIDLGESVPVDILRDGSTETIFVSPGPLGVMLEHELGEPLGE
jgi:hypothetical protein